MSDFSWWPGLIALAVGLVGGFLIARRLRGSGAAAGPPRRVRDLELVAADLEARRDELYRRLQDDEASTSSDERRALEASAARALKGLEATRIELRKAGARRHGKAPRDRSSEAPRSKTREAIPADASFSSRHPLLSGFLLGGGMVALVGVLVLWAVRDTGSGSEVASAVDEPHAEAMVLPPGAQEELEALQVQLERSPGDVMARKRLALLLLSHDQLVAAFGEAQRLLQADPRDIDGLYIEGVVRLQMGQTEQALDLLDEVLELFPDHVRALAWRGIAFHRRGDIGAAVASWERGIEAAGGQHPELEQMVMAALAEEAGLTAAAAPLQPMPSSSAPSPESTHGFPVRIEAATEAGPITAVLFVALRTDEGAPPVAVRRLDRPRFPLNLMITEGDSMMGGELPDAGVITVRLDQDGDISTTSAGDLAGVSEARVGETAAIALAPVP